MDTPREEIERLQPIKVKGLQVNVNGMILTPTRIWFGIDTTWRENGYPAGRCFYHFGNALHPVMLNGKQYEIQGLANVCARYDGKVIKDFYRE